MNTILLERRNPENNMARFYAVSVAPTLFGQWALVREWGRIGHPGTVRADWYPTENEAETARQFLTLRKARRGYRSAGDDGLDHA